MRDILTIFIVERQALLRGLIVSFLLVLPFTFLPTIINNGWVLLPIIERIPNSLFYAVGFSLVVVFVSVFQNYNNLVNRKRIFDKPAFKKLDFYGRVDGTNSITKELETFLLGRIDKYYYRLNIVDPNAKNFKIEIIPLINFSSHEELKERLKKEHNFKGDSIIGQIMLLSEQDLEDRSVLWNRLISLDKTLTEWGAVGLRIDDKDLEV